MTPFVVSVAYVLIWRLCPQVKMPLRLSGSSMVLTILP